MTQEEAEHLKGAIRQEIEALKGVGYDSDAAFVERALARIEMLERENQRLQKVAEQATSEFSQYKGRWVTPGNQFLSHRENPELAAYLAERAGTAVKTEVTEQ